MTAMSTRQDVERRLHVSASTVRRLVDRGELIAHKIGGQLRFSEPDINAYLAGVRSVSPDNVPLAGDVA